MAAPCYFPPPVNYLGLVWGRTWLPAAAQAGCHTVKDPFINKLSIRCQQPPFGLFGERSCGVESWLDQLEEFKKKKGKRQMSCSLFSATDLGYGVGFRWKEGEFKERVKEEAANRKVWRARRKHWEKQASRGTGFLSNSSCGRVLAAVGSSKSSFKNGHEATSPSFKVKGAICLQPFQSHPNEAEMLCQSLAALFTSLHSFC